ncbi:MAG: hypothetical protein ACPGSO_00720 [Vicingaceae bacterium]
MGNKKCKCCGKIKNIDEFHKNKYSSDGLTSYCKGCNKFKSFKQRRSYRFISIKIGIDNKELKYYYNLWKDSGFRKDLKPVLRNGVLDISGKRSLEVIAIYEDGSKKEFRSINQAYKETGISPGFIKFSCENLKKPDKRKGLFFQLKK